MDELTSFARCTRGDHHDPAVTFLQTGHQHPGGPAWGMDELWAGQRKPELPAFVVLISRGSAARPADPLYARLWGSGFASNHQGVAFRSNGDRCCICRIPQEWTSADDANSSMPSALSIDRHSRGRWTRDRTRIAQYEMAFRMQSSVPELTSLKGESEATLDAYGPQARVPGTFAANCLLRAAWPRGVSVSCSCIIAAGPALQSPSDLRLQSRTWTTVRRPDPRSARARPAG